MLADPQLISGVALQDDLLVSAMPCHPFPGGLFAIAQGDPPTLRIIDRLSTAGIWRDYDMFLRAIYAHDHMILFFHAPGTITVSIASQSYKEVHDVRFQFGQLFVVSTGTNEVVQLDAQGNVSYTWKFPGENGSWHLNCMDLWDGRYVISCFGRKENRADYGGSWKGEGVVFDLESGKTLWSGLTKPHTPRMDKNGRQYVCDSDTHRLLIRQVDGNIAEVHFPKAFTRGLAFGKNHIYVGLSALRHEKIAENSISNARIAVLDRVTFELVCQIDMPCSEIYDIVIAS